MSSIARISWSRCGRNKAVFERYTESARRSIFFALLAARELGSPRIDTVHLLLGILREDQSIAVQVGAGALGTIRKELEQVAPPKGERPATTGDLPLSKETQRALTFATEEADTLNHSRIDAPDLILGLLRIENCTAAKLLRAYGMDYGRYRETLRTKPVVEARRMPPMERAIQRPAPRNEAPAVPPAAPSLAPGIRALESLLDAMAAHHQADLDSYGDQRLKRKPWTRREAFGHLIDWAMAHQQWFVQALTKSKVTAQGYPGEAEIAVRHYADFSWRQTVDLWVSLNRLLVHVLLRTPEDKLDVQCRIGIAQPVPLAALIQAYIEHCEDMLGQILAHL